jgi:hypothetical protein
MQTGPACDGRAVTVAIAPRPVLNIGVGLRKNWALFSRLKKLRPELQVLPCVILAVSKGFLYTRQTK